MLEQHQANKLIQMATEARRHAYSPYSNFPVGAAVLTHDGRFFSGCNIENASFGLSNCAERTVIFNAVAAGAKRIKAIACIADTPDPLCPCGACLQVIAEFADANTHILLSNLAGTVRSCTLSELLPSAFTARDMNN